MRISLLSSAYFGPIQWYQKLNRYDETLIEGCDSFIKQTYRNRCLIATTNGIQALTVPVERQEVAGSCGGDGQTAKCMMRNVRISSHGNWQHLHWKALESAYGESPFFEYYADDIRPFFEKSWTFLYDFNMDICAKMCELIDIRPKIKPTEQFFPIKKDDNPDGRTYPDNVADFREAIRPKHPLPDEEFSPKRYYQVYDDKHGFLPNLSILDLLFNMGNESVLYL